ncbi:hypothetical protein V8E52_011597, partial [Russula decolorans]
IEIFLSSDETQIYFLSIPRSDIERLAVSPFQWIRYVMFAICGAHGDLSTTPNGPAVDYEYTEIANDENTYYYRPSGKLPFCVLSRFKRAINKYRSDNTPQGFQSRCPHSKGDEYIKRVMRLRSPEDVPVPRIDMTENGILLRKDVHSLLASGQVAFIKTPNYELRPEHIKRFSRGDEREAYITLQWIKKPEDYDPENLEELQAIQNAGIDPRPGTRSSAGLPSAVILDYIYGIAAYKAWRSRRDAGFDQMRAYRDEHYAQISPPPPPPPPSSQDDDTDVTPGPDDLNDPNYEPLPSRKRYTPTRRSGLEEAMDELNMFLMHIHGITPEMAAERNQKEIEREEQAAQEASRSKVMEW